MPSASSGGNERGSSWPSGNQADASGAFHPDPRTSTKVVKPFFQKKGAPTEAPFFIFRIYAAVLSFRSQGDLFHFIQILFVKS